MCLSNSGGFNDLEWLSKPFAYCRFLEQDFCIQSHGSYVAAELAVYVCWLTLSILWTFVVARHIDRCSVQGRLGVSGTHLCICTISYVPFPQALSGNFSLPAVEYFCGLVFLFFVSRGGSSIFHFNYLQCMLCHLGLVVSISLNWIVDTCFMQSSW